MDSPAAASILFAVGVGGLSGASVLWPLLASLAQRCRRRRAEESRPAQASPRPPSIEVIVPAHDEAAVIGRTLSSIDRAMRRLRARAGSRAPKVVVVVAADACSDATAAIAKGFPGVRVEATAEAQGKWTTLRRLCLRSRADWLVLADAGVLWPERLLTDILDELGGREVIAVAPGYLPCRAGRLHRGLWRLEAGLKRLETLCGGPVSLHGATVCYRADALKAALAFLGRKRWLNDDIVIPLVMRSLRPDGVIRYPVGEVRDAGARPRGLDVGRRRRMLLGNRQWVRDLLPFILRRNAVAGLVSLRRVFRVLWAYWLAFAAAGLALLLGVPLLPGFAVLAALFLVSGAFRQVAGAAWVSLLAPWELLVPERWLSEAWE